MGKEVAEVFDYDKVVEQGHEMCEMWKVSGRTFYTATVDLGRFFIKVHKALSVDPKGGRPKKTVSGKTKLSAQKTVSDFVKELGVSRSSFYGIIKFVEDRGGEAALLGLKGNVKLIEAVIPTPHEAELEEKITKLEDEISGRDEAIVEYEEAFKTLGEEHDDLNDQIDTLKAKLEGSENPALIERIEKLEKKEALLAQKINWTGTAAIFKKRLNSFRKKASEMTDLADSLFESVPREVKEKK